MLSESDCITKLEQPATKKIDLITSKKMFSEELINYFPIYIVYWEVSIGMRLGLISTRNGVRLPASPPKRNESIFFLVSKLFPKTILVFGR